MKKKMINGNTFPHVSDNDVKNPCFFDPELKII